MRNKRLIIGLIGLLGLLGGNVAAQNGFNMPFSRFGIGLGNQPYNAPMVVRLGGTAYTLAGNNFVNPFNPASYGAIEPESFVFDMGVNLQQTVLRDAGTSLRDADGNVAYLMVAMPVTKWWKLAAGLMPYSTVSYETITTQTDATAGTVRTVYSGGDGDGNPSGINEIFLGSAFNILRGSAKTPRLQAGFNAYYLTGNIDRAITYSFTNTSAYYLDSRHYKQTRLRNLLFDLGVQLQQPLGEHLTLGVGLVYKPYLDLKVKESALIYTLHASDETLVDTIFPARGQSTDFASRLEQAQTFGIGLSLDIDHRWRMAVDATLASWHGLKYTEGQEPSVFGTDEVRYIPYSHYAASVERTGNMDAATYWGRMSWSLGAHVAQGCLGLNIDGTEHSLGEWGVGAGVTMPMRKGRSLLTLSVGYNSLGTPDVLQYNTLTFGIAVSSCERWFFKRKFN